ncbi:uncharacterized protein LOC116263973 isoform X1 [Nymphaea colorata]|nr:uncharacterized protein LOC116263973 isoform X1 [Nymphaea colorata]XP_031499684.1 uncharacterized protein LOC116263973 isoform X1 [Nymphaea colorata]XP_031499685.1 uncharacterized protein LOC116263973 isoform X1 [Nymphaea colorata]
MVFFRSLLPRLQTLRHPPFRASLHYSVFARMKGKVAPFQDKGKKVAASQGNELVVWKGATEHGESSPREQHGSSTQTYLPLDYDYAPRLQPCACAAGDKRKSCDDSEGDDHSGGSVHQERKGCGGWLSDED